VDIRATVESSLDAHHTAVSTNGRDSSVAIAGRPGGGSALNGGELLCLALATCYCNDVFREANRFGVVPTVVRVEVRAAFGSAGEPAREITYRAEIETDAIAVQVAAEWRHTDRMAEVHNTLRAGTPVVRIPEAIPTR